MNVPSRAEVFLHPGEWYFGDKDTLIRTLLGSCVSIVFWHPLHQVGGMCHYMLTRRVKGHNAPLSGRYADEAMLLLLREIFQTGFPLEEFHVKLIGGAETLTAVDREPTAHGIAGRNIEVARTMARQLALRVKAEDLGGKSARLVVFDIETGDVWVRQSPGTSHHPGTDKKRSP